MHWSKSGLLWNEHDVMVSAILVVFHPVFQHKYCTYRWLCRFAVQPYRIEHCSVIIRINTLMDSIARRADIATLACLLNSIFDLLGNLLGRSGTKQFFKMIFFQFRIYIGRAWYSQRTTGTCRGWSEGNHIIPGRKPCWWSHNLYRTWSTGSL